MSPRSRFTIYERSWMTPLTIQQGTRMIHHIPCGYEGFDQLVCGRSEYPIHRYPKCMQVLYGHVSVIPLRKRRNHKEQSEYQMELEEA